MFKWFKIQVKNRPITILGSLLLYLCSIALFIINDGKYVYNDMYFTSVCKFLLLLVFYKDIKNYRNKLNGKPLKQCLFLTFISIFFVFILTNHGPTLLDILILPKMFFFVMLIIGQARHLLIRSTILIVCLMSISAIKSEIEMFSLLAYTRYTIMAFLIVGVPFWILQKISLKFMDKHTKNTPKKVMCTAAQITLTILILPLLILSLVLPSLYVFTYMGSIPAGYINYILTMFTICCFYIDKDYGQAEQEPSCYEWDPQPK